MTYALSAILNTNEDQGVVYREHQCEREFFLLDMCDQSDRKVYCDQKEQLMEQKEACGVFGEVMC